MDSHFYQTSQFAQKAAVSVRTLRYYDKVGLLSPSHYTEAGYRLYTDEDFPRLQQILALKFLGFSLEEVRYCLHIGPTALQEALALQRSMMQEKKAQLDAIIKAIAETEELLRTNTQDWEPIVRVIQVMQMQQTNDWRKKYFTDEQLKHLEDLSNTSYSTEDKQKIAERGKNWTEADQQAASQRWNALFTELQRLVAANQDPGSPEAQALAKAWQDLVREFTHGDSEIQQGLHQFYENMAAMPAGERPFSLPYSQEGDTFIRKAIEIYNQHQG